MTVLFAIESEVSRKWRVSLQSWLLLILFWWTRIIVSLFDLQDSMILGFWRARKVDSATQIFVDSILIDKNCWFWVFKRPEKLVGKNRWFWAFERPEMSILLKYRINILYPPWHSGIADSHFVVSLLIRNNKMGHRINKMDIHFNKVGHRNSKVGHRNNKVGVYETTKWGSVPVSYHQIFWNMWFGALAVLL